VPTRQPNVVFVHLPAVSVEGLERARTGRQAASQFYTPPLGILYLSAALKRAGVVSRVEAVDYLRHLAHIGRYASLEDFARTVAQRTVDFCPDVVAFSLNFSTSYGFFHRALPALKDLWPAAACVAGGMHATNCARLLARLDPDLDWVVCGEAEAALPALVGALGRRAAVQVRGVYARKTLLDRTSNGRPLARAEPPADLDRLPLPDWDLLDMDHYTRHQSDYHNEVKPGAPIMTTRGCPHRCTYCSAHTVHGRRVRARSPEHIAAEVRALHERWGVRLFLPHDDLFTFRKDRTLAVLAALRDLDIDGFELQYPNGLAVNTLDDEVIDALIAANTTVATVAVESGSPVVQREVIRKHVDLDRARQVVRRFRAAGVETRCFFILGFPGETRAQMEETIRYARDLHADWCHLNIAIPLVGSDMHRTFRDMGCYKEDDPRLWALACNRERFFDTPEISAADLRDLEYRANLDLNFFHNTNLREERYERALAQFTYVARRFPYHAVALYLAAECQARLDRAAEAAITRMRLGHLVATNDRAADQVRRYGAAFGMELHTAPAMAK